MNANAIALDALKKIVKNAEQSKFEDWLEAKSPSGDVEQVQRQWENSGEYREFCDKWADAFAAIAALEAEQQPEHCVDVHALLREAVEQKAERAKQLPTEQDCIRMMVQCRLRLLELGWTSGEYAPKDGKEFEGINPGFAGPATYKHLGSGFFIASPGDWWPAPRPLVFRLPTPPKD